MERYESYEDSGVEWIGEIPAGWTVIRFNNACASSLGKMLTTSPNSEDSFLAPYLKAANIQENGFSLAFVSEMFFEPNDTERYGIEKGDLLVVEGGSVGLAQIWTGEIDPCFIQNALHRVRPNNGYCTSYLKYCLDLARYTGHIDLVCNKATIAHFTKNKLLATPMPAPSFVEQQAIADYLDAKTTEIDSLSDEVERSIELLEEYRKSVISEAVTKGLNPAAPMKDSGIEWIGEIPEDWNVARLDGIAERKSGHTPDKKVPEYWDGNIVWISLADSQSLRSERYLNASNTMTTEAGIQNSSAELLPAGSVLLSRDASVGLTAIAGVPLAVSQHFMAYICGNGLYNEYLRYVFMAMHQEFERLSMGSTIPTIGLPLIKQLMIPYPPKAVQVEIVSCLDARIAEIDALIKDKQAMAGKLSEYRKSLISEAVTGKFKVPGVE